MGDFLSKELSKANMWWLPKYRYLELRYFALQYPYWKQKLVELKYDNSITHKRSDEPYLTSSKLSDRTAEIAIQRKILSDYIRMVEQAAIEAEPELYSYILKAVTENLTFVVLKQAYDMPCERDMFYDRRRKFYWALSRVR